jgi:hypothetical protein
MPAKHIHLQVLLVLTFRVSFSYVSFDGSCRYETTDPRLEVAEKWEDRIVAMMKDPQCPPQTRALLGPQWMSYLPPWMLRPLVQFGVQKHRAMVRTC